MERVYSKFHRAQVDKRGQVLMAYKTREKKKKPPFHMGFTVENLESMNGRAPSPAAVQRVIM